MYLELGSERGSRSFVHEPRTFAPLLQEERGEIFLCVNDHPGVPKELITYVGKLAWAAARSAHGKVVDPKRKPNLVECLGEDLESPFRILGQVVDNDAKLCW